jgi:hypothetical protein
MATALTLLNGRLPKLSWLDIAERNSGAIRLTPTAAQPEPRNLRRIKDEVRRGWGVVQLIDMLKEAVLRTGCRRHEHRDQASRLRRPRPYRGRTALRPPPLGGVRPRHPREHTNATFAARSTELWGQGSPSGSRATAAAGVLIYWHVEKKSLAIHYQLINCAPSEVAAMVEGAMQHGTSMVVEANYTDSHGQSEIGFGITRMLNFDLLPKIKRINKVKLCRPTAGDLDAYPQRLPPHLRGDVGGRPGAEDHLRGPLLAVAGRVVRLPRTCATNRRCSSCGPRAADSEAARSAVENT